MDDPNYDPTDTDQPKLRSVNGEVLRNRHFSENLNLKRAYNY